MAENFSTTSNNHNNLYDSLSHADSVNNLRWVEENFNGVQVATAPILGDMPSPHDLQIMKLLGIEPHIVRDAEANLHYLVEIDGPSGHALDNARIKATRFNHQNMPLSDSMLLDEYLRAVEGKWVMRLPFKPTDDTLSDVHDIKTHLAQAGLQSIERGGEGEFRYLEVVLNGKNDTEKTNAFKAAISINIHNDKFASTLAVTNEPLAVQPYLRYLSYVDITSPGHLVSENSLFNSLEVPPATAHELESLASLLTRYGLHVDVTENKDLGRLELRPTGELIEGVFNPQIAANHANQIEALKSAASTVQHWEPDLFTHTAEALSHAKDSAGSTALGTLDYLAQKGWTYSKMTGAALGALAVVPVAFDVAETGKGEIEKGDIPVNAVNKLAKEVSAFAGGVAVVTPVAVAAEPLLAGGPYGCAAYGAIVLGSGVLGAEATKSVYEYGHHLMGLGINLVKEYFSQDEDARLTYENRIRSNAIKNNLDPDVALKQAEAIMNGQLAIANKYHITPDNTPPVAQEPHH